MFISILGTEYEIKKVKYSDDERFERDGIDGYCNDLLKTIVLCDKSTDPLWSHESEADILAYEKLVKRHEIVHAFLAESGLCENANVYKGAWPRNEEMVDWIAIQGPKIFKAWQDAEAV